MTGFLTIENHGPLITAFNYWAHETKKARTGNNTGAGQPERTS